MKIKTTIIRAILVMFVLSLININTVRAIDGSYEDAMEVRHLLNPQASYPDESLATIQSTEFGETILLPVSREFDQMDTRLCWAYSTLSALETLYLIGNPEGLEVELSRRAMQYYTMEDRYLRSLKGVNTNITEAGVALDAIRLIQSNGIVSFDDYNDICDPYGQADIDEMIDSNDSFTDQIITMYNGLDIVYTAPPTQTYMPYSPNDVNDPNLIYVQAQPGELAELVLADYQWQSYTPSETELGLHDHPDPDARWETMSSYMPRSQFPNLIRQALIAGFPVIVSIGNHAIMIYGADYDQNDSPVRYYIKDSYEGWHRVGTYLHSGYYYTSGAENLHKYLWEVTTIKL